MQKVKVERVSHFQKDREDKPLIGRNGKPYERCIIQTNKGKLSGFGSAVTHNLKEGDEIELEITSKEYNGTTYQNFKLPNPNVTRVEFQEVVKRIEVLEKFMTADKQPDEPLLPEPGAEEQIDDLFTEGEG